MGELRTPNRVPSGERRRGRRDRPPIAAGADEAEGFRRPAEPPGAPAVPDPPKASVPVFQPLAYRAVVAGWSIDNRERWGRRANELEEAGLPWRDAETRAFVEVWLQLHRS